jgi:hypothetical protein
MQLSDLEKYISKNKHLPDIPSEQILLESGLDLAEMQKLQQAKIEELTLYIIQLQKKLDNLEKLIN